MKLLVTPLLPFSWGTCFLRMFLGEFHIFAELLHLG